VLTDAVGVSGRGMCWSVDRVSISPQLRLEQPLVVGWGALRCAEEGPGSLLSTRPAMGNSKSQVTVTGVAQRGCMHHKPGWLSEPVGRCQEGSWHPGLRPPFVAVVQASSQARQEVLEWLERVFTCNIDTCTR
jgi:hypothetical protein